MPAKKSAKASEPEEWFFRATGPRIQVCPHGGPVTLVFTKAEATRVDDPNTALLLRNMAYNEMGVVEVDGDGNIVEA